MATHDISLRGRRKTMLIYRSESGLALRQADTRSEKVKEIPLTEDDLDAIAAQWPKFRETLSNAGAPIAAPATPSRPAYKASPEQGSSPSSGPAQGSLE